MLDALEARAFEERGRNRAAVSGRADDGERLAPVLELGGDAVAEYFAAREIADRVDAGDAPDPGDVGQAVQGLLAIFETLVSERAAP